jgi:hypothetical protein
MKSKLLAIKIRRRMLALAVFSSRNLEHVETLHLCNEPEDVIDSAARFLACSVEKFRPDSAAIATGAVSQGERVKALLHLAETLFRAEGIPFWQIADKAVLQSYAVPALKGRRHLRPIVQSFWPYLDDKELLAFEAAALGFHVQVDRLLSLNN